MDDSIYYRKGRLFVEGVDARRIVEKYGTPAYVYSRRSILQRLGELQKALNGLSYLICYALKASSNRSICRLLAKGGAGADVVSGGELWRALKAGVPSDRIVFAGVGKTYDDILMAVKTGIRTFNIESEEELRAVARASQSLRRKAPVSIRINPGVDAGTHRHVATSLPDSKFGVEPREAVRLYRFIQQCPWLEARGIHCHIGSQITRVGPYRTALRSVLKIIDDLERRGQFLRHIDLGGGFGIGYENKDCLSLTAYGDMLRRELGNRPGLELIVEPGRYLVAESGLLLTQVVYRKRSPKSRFVILDAGMNDLMRPALYGAKHPIVPIQEFPGRPRALLDVAGPVCESADIFARKVSIPYPECGDIWAILKAGAYGFSMSSQYNSRPRPPEILINGDRMKVIRVRETYEDLVRREA